MCLLVVTLDGLCLLVISRDSSWPLVHSPVFHTSRLGNLKINNIKIMMPSTYALVAQKNNIMLIFSLKNLHYYKFPSLTKLFAFA